MSHIILNYGIAIVGIKNITIRFRKALVQSSYIIIPKYKIFSIADEVGP